MGHLLSSAIGMQTSAAPATASIQYSFADFAGIDSTMYVYFNAGSVTLSNSTSLTTATLSPTVQTISSNMINFADTGTAIEYYINDIFIDQFLGGSTSNTGDITTSAGNTYKFVGTAG